MKRKDLLQLGGKRGSRRLWPAPASRLLLLKPAPAACLLLLLLVTGARAQEVIDRTVATVTSGGRTDLVTYSDLLWQLALEPDAALAKPNPETLNRVLRRLIDIRLIALEAEKLPTINPTQAEIEAEIKRLIGFFPTRGEFESRLQAVGFHSADDEEFLRLIGQRVAIEKYINFRFYSFVVITAQDIETYYREVYVPDYQRRNPGQIVPTLDTAAKEIEEELRNRRVAADIDAFLEGARDRAEITTLYPDLTAISP